MSSSYNSFVILGLMCIFAMVILTLTPTNSAPTTNSLLKGDYSDAVSNEVKYVQEIKESSDITYVYDRNANLPKLPTKRIGNVFNRNKIDNEPPSIHGQIADEQASKLIKVSAYDNAHVKSGYEGNFFGIRTENLKYFEHARHACINNHLYTIKRIEPHKHEHYAYIYITERLGNHTIAKVGDLIKLHRC